MKVLLINGSPSGKDSVTLKTAEYLQVRFPEDTFETVHAAVKIRSLEKDFSPAVKAMEEADVILFVYPVYTFTVPSQLHRFIELTKESGIDLTGKFASQISTSKHFYDITAHGFIEDNCRDMGLKVVRGLSADMEDLLKPAGRRDAENWYDFLRFCVENDIYDNVQRTDTEDQCSGFDTRAAAQSSYDTVIVTDLAEDDEALKKLIDDFRAVYKYRTKVINLAEFHFAGGCLGCFRCAASGDCIYKDGFQDLLRNEIQSGSAIIYAFTIKDHSMGSSFKTYDDRQFCNGHRTVTEGMPIAYIVNGDLDAEPNLRTMIEARAEVGGNYLAGCASDSVSIGNTAARLAYAIENKLTLPKNFYGVGGMKIFRDLIWVMRGLMREDHRFYKERGVYDDLPQKHMGKMFAVKMLGMATRNDKLMKKAGVKMTAGMAMPYDRIIKKAKEKKQ